MTYGSRDWSKARRARDRGAKKRWSVRARTTLVASLVVSSALLLGSIIMVELLRSELTANVIETAKNESVNIVSLVQGGELPNPIPIPRGDLAAQVIAPDGKVIAFTQNLEGERPQYQFPQMKGTSQTVVRQSNNAIAQVGDHDHNYILVANRVDVAVPVETQAAKTYEVFQSKKQSKNVIFSGSTAPGNYYVYVWASLQSVDQSVRTLLLILLAGFPLLITVVVVATWLTSKKAFEAVERIRVDVDEISETNLSRRVYEPSQGDEISRLAHTMNQMLERLEISTEERKRFVADASHELKSPLSALRASLEIAIRHPDEVDWVATARTGIAESQRMQHIIEDLLLLAKADAGQLLGTFQSVDIDELAVEECQRLRALTDVRFDLSDMSAGRIQGDSERIRSVVRNLLENAVRHASSQVWVSLKAVDSHVVFQVADDGKGVREQDREKIFDRFTRLDESRSRDRGGSGLGLAIVKSIVIAHGGTISVSDNDRCGHGAQFTAVFEADSCSVLESDALPFPPLNVNNSH
ncbi:Signal transduction histidine kinase [Ferrithrix thermotolerans DSM 19514]|uniref:histidine kinase n=1 Tax=Ferrithrix thermotolerans DSM 19514 TaxID=1121881 RepID=A0A1M4VVT0_9ACTN|nr:Signal transduction histidine kinase [Ferrithrix thermotolerans DSM 19514]